jgi:hypothetical protein
MAQVHRLGANANLGGGFFSQADHGITMKNCYFLGEYTTAGTASREFAGAFIGKASLGNSSVFTPESRNLFYYSTVVNGSEMLKGLGKSSVLEGEDVACITALNSANAMKEQNCIDLLNDGRTGENAVWSIKEGINNGFPVPFAQTLSTGITQAAEETPFKIITSHGNIQVENLEDGTAVKLYNLQGILFASSVAANHSVFFAATKGLYFVQASGRTVKVVL